MRKLRQTLLATGMLLGTLSPSVAQETLSPIGQCAQELALPTGTPRLFTPTQSIEPENRQIALDSTLQIFSLAITGKLSFWDEEGYLSIVLEDTKGRKYLVYRNAAVFNTLEEPILLQKACWESAFLLGGLNPRQLTIKAKGCTFELNKVYSSSASQLRQGDIPLSLSLRILKEDRKNQIDQQIANINRVCAEKKLLWRAKRTPLSELNYTALRREFFNLSEEDALGFEHYGGGVYTPLTRTFDRGEFIDDTTGPFVEYFDWSDRHGINWHSPCRWQQETLSCWAQAAASAIEAHLNRFYGKKSDKKVSILDIIACSGGLDTLYPGALDTCGPGFLSKAMYYLANQRVVSEDDFPFVNRKYRPCDEKPTNPEKAYKVEKITSFNVFEPNKIMNILINKGPIAIAERIEGHAMLLSGYGVVKKNSKFLPYFADAPVDIPADHPMVGKVYWSLKNSFGEGWGDNGFCYFLRIKDKRTGAWISGNFGEMYYISGTVTEYRKDGYIIRYSQKDVKYYDEDGDGYYRWGLKEKGPGKLMPTLQDGDDSDPLAGPMDKFGHCLRLKETDLYIRDIPQDKGVEPFCVQADHWESPDIWVRKGDNDGEEHQDPDYQEGKECYPRVRVHNKGTKPSSHRAMVRLYWSYGSPTQWWESFYGKEYVYAKGEKLISGGCIGNFPIQILQPGESTVIKIKWKMPKAYLPEEGQTNTHICLMAEIIEPQDNFYTVDHSDFAYYVQANNNVAQKNVHLIDVGDPINPNINIDFLISQKQQQGKQYRLEFKSYNALGQEITNDLIEQAEVSCSFTQAGTADPDLRSLILDRFDKVSSACFVMKDSVSSISGIKVDANRTAIARLKVNFLTQKETGQNEFILKVKAFDEVTKKCVGGETYIIRKKQRPQFKADFNIIEQENSFLVNATEIGEKAQYTWTDNGGNVLGKGEQFRVDKNSELQTLTLSVEATKDGFKDYRSKQIVQGEGVSAVSAYPNPTEGILTLTLPPKSKAGVINIFSTESGNLIFSKPVSSGEEKVTLDLYQLQAGLYAIDYYIESKLVTHLLITKK